MISSRIKTKRKSCRANNSTVQANKKRKYPVNQVNPTANHEHTHTHTHTHTQTHTHTRACRYRHIPSVTGKEGKVGSQVVALFRQRSDRKEAQISPRKKTERKEEANEKRGKEGGGGDEEEATRSSLRRVTAAASSAKKRLLYSAAFLFRVGMKFLALPRVST